MSEAPHILVTGAAGLLGHRLVCTLLRRGHRVTALFHRSTWGISALSRAAVLPCDLASDEECLAVAARLEPGATALAHCAALTDIDRCEREPAAAYRANVLGTRNAARLATELGARLVYVSTASVFSCTRGGYTEDESPSPPNVYGWTKLAGEEITLATPGGRVVRLNLVGLHPYRPDGRNLLEWLVGAVREGRNLRLFSDVRLNLLSDLTASEVLADLSAYEGGRRVFHLGSRDIVSKAALGRMVIKRLGGRPGSIEEVSVNSARLAAARPKELWLDTTSSASELALRLPSVEEEVDRILTSARDGIAARAERGTA